MIEKPYLIKLNKKYNQKKGYLICLEDYELNLEFKRIFWISGLDGINQEDERGNHGHANADEFIIVLRGSCHFFTKNSDGINTDFIINNDDKALYLPKGNILVMKEFTDDALLLVVCDVNFKNDEIIY